jgi:Dipeptidyl aminopeptidases/acylaminoacyl-peptidases
MTNRLHRSIIAMAAIAAGLSSCMSPERAWSQSRIASPLLPGMDIGAHAVGFQSFWAHDASRTWRPAVDPSRRFVAASALRPVRINVWYPAASNSRVPMKFGDYVGSARTPGFADDEARVRSDDLGGEGRGLRGLFKTQAAFKELMATPTLAHRDAPLEKGKFPIIVYSLGQGDYTQENTPLCEYLASRGFVVVSVPGLGTSPRRSVMFVHDEPSYDNQVRDLAFALSTVIARFPSADGRRIAAVGHSMGGVYALMLAMRYSIIQTVVGLDPSFVASRPSYFYRYQQAPEYDAANFTGSLLALHKPDDADMAIVDSLRFTDRTLITVDSTVHADFNGFPTYTARAPVNEVDTFAIARRSQATAMNTYRSVSEYVACFLELHLDVTSAPHGPCPNSAKCSAAHTSARRPHRGRAV